MFLFDSESKSLSKRLSLEASLEINREGYVFRFRIYSAMILSLLLQFCGEFKRLVLFVSTTSCAATMLFVDKHQRRVCIEKRACLPLAVLIRMIGRH